MNARIVHFATTAAAGILTLATASLLVAFSGSAQAQATIYTFEGHLDSGDPTFPGGEYYDIYPIEVTAGMLVEVDMRSTAFDTYLLVVHPDLTVWENDDHHGSTSHSRIAQVAPETGTYHVYTTSFSGGQTGAYTLSVTQSDGGIFPPCPTSAGPFVVVGGAYTRQGRRIGGALVTADNQTFPGSNQQTTTGSDGCYRIDLPPIAATWALSATVSRQYNGRTFRFDLHTDPAPLAGNTGGVRNVEWRLSGPRPEGGVYGSPVLVYTPLEVLETDVELTLSPIGVLVDGSEGTTITRRVVSTGDGWAVPDVPLGRYRIAARHVPTGAPMEIRPRNQGDYLPAVTLDFDAPFGSLPIYWIEVEARLASGTDAEDNPAPQRHLKLTAAPNPAGGMVHVSVEVEASQPISVALYDALGRHRAQLHDGPLGAGRHAFQLDAGALAPGLYFVRATSPTEAAVHRITVVH